MSDTGLVMRPTKLVQLSGETRRPVQTGETGTDSGPREGTPMASGRAKVPTATRAPGWAWGPLPWEHAAPVSVAGPRGGRYTVLTGTRSGHHNTDRKEM